MKKLLLALTCTTVLTTVANAQTFIPLSYDGLVTWPSGIRGNTITAASDAPGQDHPSIGVIFNLANNTWNVLSPTSISVPYGPSVNGRVTVGMMQVNGIPQGYIYNNINGSITQLSVPGHVATVPHSVFNGETVGSAWNSKSTAPSDPSVGFAYQHGSYQTINFPGAYNTQLYGIWDNIIAGTYRANAGAAAQGFLYNQQTGKFVSYDFPGATSTTFHGISAGSHVGSMEITGVMNIGGQQQGFALILSRNGRQTWIPIGDGVRTSGNSISGNTVVGVTSPSAKGHDNYQGYSVNINMSAHNRSATNVAGSCAASIKEECVAAPTASSGGGGGATAAPIRPWTEDEFRYW